MSNHSFGSTLHQRKPENMDCIVAFFAFIGFFPQLVAGPIERATNLLPQFLQKREFSYEQAADGMRQILWGLFKKIVVADTCAIYVDQVFSTYSTQTGSALVIAAVLFTFQIYGDFSGYSDIAIDAKLQQSLFQSRHRRVLEKVAHLVDHLVQGLCLYSYGGKPCRDGQNHP